ncbi:hypothetical protein F66182_4433 [Fusarium sp. NRRL 66182]|nr:hypothetical protein F66182_4433 [Fusarium sp. NRRL 66182]
MPRNGDGSSDNGPFQEADHNIAHGVGKPDLIVSLVQSDRVDRADKTAPLPEGKDEQGLALNDANASGGQSQGVQKGDNVGQGN